MICNLHSRLEKSSDTTDKYEGVLFDRAVNAYVFGSTSDMRHSREKLKQVLAFHRFMNQLL